MPLHNNKFDSAHFETVEKKAKKIEKLFTAIINEVTQNSLFSYDISNDGIFSFDSNPRLKKYFGQVMKEVSTKMTKLINDQTKDSWIRGNEKVVQSILPTLRNNKVLYNAVKNAKEVNLNALKSFQERKTNGLNLSDRVWNITKTFKQEMEFALDLSISEGKSAQDISRQVRKLLKNPDMASKMFREKHGNKTKMKLEKGVYQSSYRNAMRLARTENNIAYHSASHEKYKEFDFVVGIEVRLSNNLAHCPFCSAMAGKYPKDFKFTGWHPQCRCTTIPILKTEKELQADNDAIARGENPSQTSKNEVKRPPKNFIEYIGRNAVNIESKQNKPYFYSDNLKYVKLAKTKEKTPKTELQKQQIQEKWDKRRAYYDGIIKEYEALRKEMLEFPIDFSTEKLDKLFKEYKLLDLKQKTGIESTYMELFKSNVKDLEAVMTNGKEFVKKFGFEAVNEAKESAISKIKYFENSGDIDYKIKKLKFEIGWVTDKKAYDTWEVAVSVYKKELQKTEFVKAYTESKELFDSIKLKTKGWKAKAFKDLYKDVDEKLGAIDLLVVDSEKIEALNKSLASLNEFTEQTIARRLAKKTNLKAVDYEEMPRDVLEDLFDEFENAKISVEEMDKLLRPETEAYWERLTNKEKVISTKYTQTFSYLNEPLRNIQYYGSEEKKNEHEKDKEVLTKVLSGYKLKKNLVVRRGTDDFPIPRIGKRLSELEEGDIFNDGAFLSTAVHKTKGFHSNTHELVIVFPKKSMGLYAEPFTKYNGNSYDYKGKLWNGKDVASIGCEQEWIGQRGSRFKVIKRVGRKIFVQLIGQLYDH